MKCHWIAFASVIIIGLLMLGWAGYRIYQEKPPIPELVVT
jgi:nitric oxide reductase subunit B